MRPPASVTSPLAGFSSSEDFSRIKPRKGTVDTAPSSVAPSLLVTPQSTSQLRAGDSDGDANEDDRRDDWQRDSGRCIEDRQQYDRFVSDHSGLSRPGFAGASAADPETSEERRMRRNDVDYYYGRARDRIDTGRTASSAGTFVTARTHRSVVTAGTFVTARTHRSVVTVREQQRGGMSEIRAERSLIGSNCAGAAPSAVRGNVRNAEDRPVPEGVSEKYGSFNDVEGNIRLKPNGIEIHENDKEGSGAGLRRGAAKIHSPNSAFQLPVRVQGKSDSFMAPMSDKINTVDEEGGSSRETDPRLRGLNGDEGQPLDARDEDATKDTSAKDAEPRVDASSSYDESEHRILLDARPSSAQTIWTHLQSWLGGGFSFCATPRGSRPTANNDTNEDNNQSPYGNGKGGGPAMSSNVYATPGRRSADIFNFGNEDDRCEGANNLAKTVVRRNGRMQAVDWHDDSRLQYNTDHSKTIKRRNGRAVAEGIEKDALPQLLPIAVVGGMDSNDNKRVQMTQAMGDPALLAGTHYLGWDGRRSHYTVLSDQTDLLCATPNVRRLEYGDGKGRSTQDETKRHQLDAKSPYWQSPDAHEQLGDAMAVVHVVQSPRNCGGVAPPSIPKQASSEESFNPPRSPVEQQILSSFLSYSDDDSPYFGSVEEDQYPQAGLGRKNAAEPTDQQNRSSFLSYCSGPGGRPPLPLPMSRNVSSPLPSSLNPPNRIRANTGNSYATISTRGTAKTKGTQASHHRRIASVATFDADTLSRICAVDYEEFADRDETRVPRETSTTTPSSRKMLKPILNHHQSNSSIRNIGELNIDRDDSDVSPIEDDFSPLTTSLKKKAVRNNVPTYEDGMQCTPVRRSEHHLARRQHEASEVECKASRYFFERNGAGINSNLFGSTAKAQGGENDRVTREFLAKSARQRDNTIVRQGSNSPPQAITTDFPAKQSNKAPKQAKMSPVRELKIHLRKSKTPTRRSKSPSRRNSTSGRQGKTSSRSKTPSRRNKTPSRRSKTPSRRNAALAMEREAEMYLPVSTVFKTDLRVSRGRGACLFEGWVALSKGDRLIRSLMSSGNSRTLEREDFRYVIMMSDAPYLHMFPSTSKKGEGYLDGEVISLDLSHNVTVGTMLVSKKHGHCVVIRDKTSLKPLCTLLPTLLRPCFFSDKAQSRLVSHKKFSKITELLFLPLLPEEREWEINRRSKHEALEIAMPHLHQRMGSEWGDPEHILEFAPPSQLNAAMRTLFAIDRVIKDA